MFGQQYANPASTAAKWIFLGFIIVVTMAVLLGGNLKEATWLNSDIAEAEAQRIEIEASHQRATYQLQERLATAQTEADVLQIQREQSLLDAQYEHDKQVLQQDIINRQSFTETIINLAIYIGSVSSIAAAICGVILAIAKAIVMVKSIQSQPKGQAVANPVKQEPLKDYHREYLGLKNANRDLKHRNQYLAERNKQLVRANHKLAQFCQRLVAEKQELDRENFDIEQLVENMKIHRDPAKTTKGDYKDKPLVGD